MSGGFNLMVNRDILKIAMDANISFKKTKANILALKEEIVSRLKNIWINIY